MRCARTCVCVRVCGTSAGNVELDNIRQQVCGLLSEVHELRPSMMQHFTELGEKFNVVQQTTAEIQRHLDEVSHPTQPEAAVYVTGESSAVPLAATTATTTIPLQCSVERMSPIRLGGATECANRATRDKDFAVVRQSTIRRRIDGTNFRRSTTTTTTGVAMASASTAASTSAAAAHRTTSIAGAAGLKRQDATTEDLSTVADHRKAESNGSTAANFAYYQF